MTQTKKKDWVGRWYDVARSLGRNDINIFGRAQWNRENHQVENVERLDFSHAVMDGAGAMVTCLRERGDQEIGFPGSPRNTIPPLRQRLGQILRSQKLMSQSQVQWQDFDLKRQELSPGEFSIFAFDAEETAVLRSHCQSHGFSQNAYLLTRLHQISSQLLKDSTHESRWLFPVNMRGHLKSANPAQNHSSAIPLSLDSSTSPQELHQQVKQRLSENIHWGNWWAYNSSRFMSEKRMKKIFARSTAKNFWMGTYSDMGRWQSGAGYQGLGETEIWFATPPGSENYPISCVPFEFNGMLSITIKVHPSITAIPRPDQWLIRQFENELRRDLGLTEPQVAKDSPSERGFEASWL